MGCGSSRGADGEKDNAIDCDFQETKIKLFDDFFGKAKEVLEPAEELRSGIQDAPDEGKEICETWRLKEYNYLETVRVCFWSLSANAGGKIANTKFEIMTESPFIGLDKSALNEETSKLIDSVIKFLKTAAKAVLLIPEIIIKVTQLVQEAIALTKGAVKAATSSGLSLKDAIKAAKNTAINVKKLSKGLWRLKNVAALLPSAGGMAKDVIPKLKELYQQADEVGGKAHAADIKKPVDIFMKFHEAPKKTEEEIAAEKFAAENAAAIKKAEKEKKAQEKREKKEAEKKAKLEKKEQEKREKEEKKAAAQKK